MQLTAGGRECNRGICFWLMRISRGRSAAEMIYLHRTRTASAWCVRACTRVNFNYMLSPTYLLAFATEVRKKDVFEKAMGKMSLATQSRVVALSESDYTLSKIQRHLASEDITVSKKSLCLLLRKYRTTGSVADHQTAKPPRKLTDEHNHFIDDCMADDDELTATKLQTILKERYPSLEVSVSMIKRALTELRWTTKKKRYGALVSEANQEKHVEWCKEQQETGDVDFDDVLYTDICTVQLESHRRITFYKKGQPIKYKNKPKHPPKVNVWTGISSRGATKVQ